MPVTAQGRVKCRSLARLQLPPGSLPRVFMWKFAVIAVTATGLTLHGKLHIPHGKLQSSQIRKWSTSAGFNFLLRSGGRGRFDDGSHDWRRPLCSSSEHVNVLLLFSTTDTKSSFYDTKKTHGAISEPSQGQSWAVLMSNRPDDLMVIMNIIFLPAPIYPMSCVHSVKMNIKGNIFEVIPITCANFHLRNILRWHAWPKFY